MSLASIYALFPSFTPGKQLVDGGDCLALVNQLMSSKTGLVALAGGGQAGATPLPAALNELTIVASANDSALLPLALAGITVTVVNSGANSAQVFGQAVNPNTGVGDTIIPDAAVAPNATAVGVAQASAKQADYFCVRPGVWKQALAG